MYLLFSEAYYSTIQGQFFAFSLILFLELWYLCASPHTWKITKRPKIVWYNYFSVLLKYENNILSSPKIILSSPKNFFFQKLCHIVKLLL